MAVADVLVLLPYRADGLSGSDGRVLSEAARLAGVVGGRAGALMLGPPGAAGGAAGIGRYGVGEVTIVEDEAFGRYSPELFTEMAAEHVQRGAYGVVLVAADSFGMDLAPRVAATLDVPLVTDVVELRVVDGKVLALRPVYSGKLMATTEIDATPVMASLRVSAFSSREAPLTAEVSTVVPNLPDIPWATKVVERNPAGPQAVSLTEASVVIAGGRGLQDPAHWHILEELRDAFGSRAALGASRAVVDAGWRPHSEQVGQTGKTVSPDLYVAVGISGAVQHLAGMRTSGAIVAINRDPDAPIFRVADFGIVGDLFEIVPRLTREVAAAKAEG